MSQYMCRVHRRKVIKSHTDTRTYYICKPEQAEMKDDREKIKIRFFLNACQTLLFSFLKPKKVWEGFLCLYSKLCKMCECDKKNTGGFGERQAFDLFTQSNIFSTPLTNRTSWDGTWTARRCWSYFPCHFRHFKHFTSFSTVHILWHVQEMPTDDEFYHVTFVFLSHDHSLVKFSHEKSCPLIVPLTRYVRACRCLWGDSDVKTKKKQNSSN